MIGLPDEWSQEDIDNIVSALLEISPTLTDTSRHFFTPLYTFLLALFALYIFAFGDFVTFAVWSSIIAVSFVLFDRVHVFQTQTTALRMAVIEQLEKEMIKSMDSVEDSLDEAKKILDDLIAEKRDKQS